MIFAATKAFGILCSCVICFTLPLVLQQSKPELDQALLELLQLLLPHTKLPAQSESLSQSPSSMPQGFDELQQPQSLLLASQADVKIARKQVKLYGET